MSRSRVWLDLAPEDRSPLPRRPTWIQLLARLRYCARQADRTRGTVMNLEWLHWNGEYGAALDALEAMSHESVDAMRAWLALMDAAERAPRRAG